MRIAALLTIVSLAFSGCTANVGPAHAPNWEYKQDRVCIDSMQPATVHDLQIAELLELRGRDAWELVSITPTSTTTETCYLLIFKRESVR